jgi:hypothetical protein
MKGRGLSLGAEVRFPDGARPGRQSAIRESWVDFDWPHGKRPERTWKRHRMTQYRRTA